MRVALLLPTDPMDYANELESQSAILAKQALKLAAEARRKHRVPKGMPGEIGKDLEKDLNAKVDDMEDKRLAFYDQQQKANLFLTRRRGTSCAWRLWMLW